MGFLSRRFREAGAAGVNVFLDHLNFETMRQTSRPFGISSRDKCTTTPLGEWRLDKHPVHSWILAN